jgi:hypothetical protein
MLARARWEHVGARAPRQEAQGHGRSRRAALRGCESPRRAGCRAGCEPRLGQLLRALRGRAGHAAQAAASGLAAHRTPRGGGGAPRGAGLLRTAGAPHRAAESCHARVGWPGTGGRVHTPSGLHAHAEPRRQAACRTARLAGEVRPGMAATRAAQAGRRGTTQAGRRGWMPWRGPGVGSR